MAKKRVKLISKQIKFHSIKINHKNNNNFLNIKKPVEFDPLTAIKKGL